MAKQRDLDDEIAQLNALVREAHECIKDLQTYIKTAQLVGDELRSVIQTEFREQFTAEANRVFGYYMDHVTDAITEAEQLVYKRFDVLCDTLLGVTKQQRRAGSPNLEELAKEAVEAANAEKNRLV